MEEITEKESEKQEFRKLSEERVYRILSILFPHGHSSYNGTRFVGPVPCYGAFNNVMEVILNEEGYGAPDTVFHLFLHSIGCDVAEKDLFGYYVGVMNVIAPELVPVDDNFTASFNVLSFAFRGEEEMANNPWKNMSVWL